MSTPFQPLNPLALCLCLLLSILPTPSLCSTPPVTTLPYSIWQGFVPTSVRYSNRTGLLYQLGSDVWEDTTVSPYLTIADFTTATILHRRHYIESHAELDLSYQQHLVWDGTATTPPLLLLLLYSSTTKSSYLLRADGYTGAELSFVALPYLLWLMGLDVSGSVVYTFVGGSSEFVSFDASSGKRVQAYNASGGLSNIYAGCVHPLTGHVYVHETDLQAATINRIAVVSPSLNTVVSSHELPPMHPTDDELVDTQLAVDGSGEWLDVFLSIVHADNVMDYYVHQFAVSTGHVKREVQMWHINELTALVTLQGQISAGPAGSDWLVVNDWQRQAYWQQTTYTNTTVLIGLPILPFNFHVLVDDDSHHVFVSTGDTRSITVLEVDEQGNLVQQFNAGDVDCGNAGFYAPIAALDYYNSQLLVPQCNQTIQLFDRTTARWVGQYSTNQTVNLVIIAADRTHHRLYMTTDESNVVAEVDLRTWQVTQQFITGSVNETDGQRVRALVVDEQRRLLYAGEYFTGQLYTFSLDQPTEPLSVHQYIAPSGSPWSFTSLALSANGTLLYASLNTYEGETTVAVIDLQQSAAAIVQQLVYPSLGDGRYFSFIGGLAVDIERDVFYLSVGDEDGVFSTKNFTQYVVPPSSYDSGIGRQSQSTVKVLTE